MSKQKEPLKAPEGSLRAALDTLLDHLLGQGRVHPLGGILGLAVCAMLCGARSLYAMSQWGQDCGLQIRVALGLSQRRGPSAATLHRVFRGLDHAAFELASSLVLATSSATVASHPSGRPRNHYCLPWSWVATKARS